MGRKNVGRRRPAKGTTKASTGGSLKTRALGPAADEFGKEIVPLGPRAGALAVRVGNLLLGVLEGTVYGIEQVSAWLHDAVAKRLKEIPEERVIQPDPRIVIPAVQALVYSMGEEHIREMFANLVATNMTVSIKAPAHPAFVEMIKQMTALDAEILAIVSKRAQVGYRVRLVRTEKWNDLGYHFSFVAPIQKVIDCRRSVNNLQRLGILEIREFEWPVVPEDSERYGAIEKLYEHLPVSIGASSLEANEPKAQMARLEIIRQGIFLTPLGDDFARVCKPQLLKANILSESPSSQSATSPSI